MADKIAIVARAGTSAFAPWHDKEWEIWGMPWISYPRLDVAFEVHSQKCVDENQDDDNVWLGTFTRKYPDVVTYCDPSRSHLFKHPVEYPLAEVLADLPIPSLENTISYMLALAILRRPAEIGLWGVHMFAGYEAQFAAPSVCYLIGLAHGRGIKVTIPPGSPLFMSNFVDGRYGVRGGKNAMRPKIVSYAGVAPYPTER